MYMKFSIILLLKLNILVLVVLPFLASSHPVFAQGRTITADTDGIDEIVVVGTDGFVYVYDYNGDEVYKSPEGGWEFVTTADLNQDNDQEIIAVNDDQIKVYDPQVSGTQFTFSVTYNGSGDFIKVDTGHLVDDDNIPDIALLRSSGSEGRIIIYDPPNTSPRVDEKFLTDWDDFAIGDYDGDDDDDFSLIFWDDDLDDGNKSWLELRRGNDPETKLESSDNAGQYSNSQWFDIVTGNFTDNGDKVEWVGSQNIGDNVIAQRWSNQEIKKIWAQTDIAFQFLATADFRDEDIDQVAMLRNVSSGTSLRFSNHQGVTWVELSGLGKDWKNLAAGNVDNDSKWREVVLLKESLIRVYRRAQSSSVNDFDCSVTSNCLEITGSFKGALALGDLGVDLEQFKPKPFEVNPSVISRTTAQSRTISSAQLTISGEKAFNTPLTWGATIIPYVGSVAFRKALAANPDLAITITPDGMQYERAGNLTDEPTVPWLSLSTYSGNTTADVTVAFSNTNVGSPVHDEGTYKATIIVVQNDLPEDRVRLSDVTLIVGVELVYLPLVIR